MIIVLALLPLLLLTGAGAADDDPACYSPAHLRADVAAHPGDRVLWAMPLPGDNSDLAVAVARPGNGIFLFGFKAGCQIGRAIGLDTMADPAAAAPSALPPATGQGGA